MWHEGNVVHRSQPTRTNYHCPRRGNHLHHYDNNAENGFVGVGHLRDHIYYPFSYVMVNDDVQEQENHRHSTFSQMLMSRPPPPSTPEPSSLPSMMLSSPHLSGSYYVHQPFTTTMQQPQQPTLLPPAPEPSLSVGCNTIQQPLQPARINYYEHNERSSEAAAARIIKNDSPSSCFSRIGGRTSDPSMKSTVIFNKNPQQHRTSNDDGIISEQSNQTKTQFETTLNDVKVVDVCKRTILAAMNKIMFDNYGSALNKLHKTIRVLEVLIFTEDYSRIGTAKTNYFRPWLETLKDMELKITQIQEKHNNDDHSLENIAITMAEDTYRNQVKQLSRRNRSSRNDCEINNEGGGRLYHFWWKSKLRRYRTTGKLIVEHHQRNTKLRPYRRNK